MYILPFTFTLANIMLYRALHNITTDIKEYDVSPGTTWLSLVCSGSPGRSKTHLWVRLALFLSSM